MTCPGPDNLHPHRRIKPSKRMGQSERFRRPEEYSVGTSPNPARHKNQANCRIFSRDVRTQMHTRPFTAAVQILIPARPVSSVRSSRSGTCRASTGLRFTNRSLRAWAAGICKWKAQRRPNTTSVEKTVFCRPPRHDRTRMTVLPGPPGTEPREQLRRPPAWRAIEAWGANRQRACRRSFAIFRCVSSTGSVLRANSRRAGSAPDPLSLRNSATAS